MPRALSRSIPTALALVLAAGLVLSVPGRAPAAEETGYSQKVVLQNERVRAVLNTYPPGTASPEHEHRGSRVVVVVEGGTLEVRDVSGKTSTLSLKSGDIVWRGPEKHSLSNSGSTPVRLVEIDLLDPPKK